MSAVEVNPKSSIDVNNGYCAKTKTYHSLMPNTALPPESVPLSVTDYTFSLLKNLPSPESSTALIDADTGYRISFSELIRRSRNLAAYLQNKIGLVNGETAFILSPNSIYTTVLHFSLFSLGVIISPSNPANTESEIAHQINLIKPAIAFATKTTSSKIPPLRHSTILLDSSDFHSMMTSESITELKSVSVSQSDVAAILYSSGTTGKTKGVKLTHRNWIAAIQIAKSLSTASAPAPAEEKPVVFCVVPCFHVYGFAFSVVYIALGGSVVLMDRFDMGRMMRGIERFGVTLLAVAPPVIINMVKNDEVMDGYDLSSLKIVVSGGAVLPKWNIEKFANRFPHVQIVQGYGLTESIGGVSRQMGPEDLKVIGTVGRLCPNWVAKVVDPETGVSLPPLKQGELWIKGPTLMQGYVGDDEATSASMDLEGWYRTGDLVYFDNKGLVFFVERLKELIKYKGYQVAPADLEHVLQSHPDVVEAAVIPFPDEEAGQIPMAFVVRRRESTIDEAEIKDFVARQVAPYKKIRRVSFIDSIPRNAAGKVLRKELIKLAQKNVSSKL
ncbi:AMP-dependent synthetase/ligase [Dillenia turbinata]|uniref:AMP-dependent synthetase/ligase n=1 Tax=Dillenia turbinata TaxID=194707 RepID=A0AAN8UUS3_9MAGN